MTLKHILTRLSRTALCVLVCLITLGGLLHLLLYDGLVGLLLDDTTVYAPGYSEKTFKKIRVGMSEHDVLHILGKPLSEGWYYPPPENRYICQVHFDVEGLVSHPELDLSVQKGMTKDQVLALLGSPPKKSWGYTGSPTSGDYRLRVLRIEGGVVTKILHEAYLD